MEQIEVSITAIPINLKELIERANKGEDEDLLLKELQVSFIVKPA